MEPAVDLIGSVPLFEGLDPSLRGRIEAVAEVASVDADQLRFI